jgi:hypothetical protein
VALPSPDLTDRLEHFLERMEAQPGRPFSQEEIDEVRQALTTFRRTVARLETMGWAGKWLLWLLGTAVLILSQWDALRGRLGW